MKYLFIIFAALLTFSFSNCSKSKDATPAVAPVDTSFNLSKATLLKQGSFTGNMNYTATGSVKLYDYLSKKYIYFENFSGSNGPDLKVYVATTNTATQFVNLGPLKGISGTQVYAVTNPPDFSQYNKVLIWCQQFSVLFGSSTLQ
jgi:Electron transfer DM13